MVLLASENKRTAPILEDLILRTIRIKATKSRRSAAASFTLCASLAGKISSHGVTARKGGWATVMCIPMINLPRKRFTLSARGSLSLQRQERAIQLRSQRNINFLLGEMEVLEDQGMDPIIKKHLPSWSSSSKNMRQLTSLWDLCIPSLFLHKALCFHLGKISMASSASITQILKMGRFIRSL